MRPESKEIAATPANSVPPSSLLYRNEKEALKPWVNFLGLALIALQFFIVLRTMDRFKLENDAFRMCIQFAFYGFIAHHLLPMKARLPFFLLLSLGVTGYVLGLERGGFNFMTSVERTGLLLVLGAICIGICHLPVHFYARVGILVALGTALWLMRASILPMGPLAPLWPVFGAMFMFRLMIYLYDLQHEKQRPPLAMIGSYFFMLPNVALTLFPVVDYKQFAKNYYAEDTFTAYQRGVHWMARGVILLVLWRLLYYHIYIGPAQVHDGTDLIRFILSNVLLYIRVPGEFHLVIGLLTLFGFNLPETNRKFLFADSFTDYWRRVNIYWKDFMMKLVFYPAIFRMKTWNQTTAMIVATTIAFIITWALHSYQWFWLRGAFPIITQDLIFWGMLGVLVITNSVIEQRSGRQRALGGVRKLGPKELAIQSLKVMGVFTTMTMLWSFWNLESVPQWLGLMKLADANTFLWFLAANVLVVIAKYVFEHYLTPPPPPKKKLGAAAEPKMVPIFPFKPAFLYVALPLFAVFFFTSSRVVKRFGPGAEVVVHSLASTKPNATDQAQQERGYYDDLMDVSRFNAQLNESLTRAPADWKKLEDTDAERFSNDHRVQELVPSKTSVVNGKTITTNKWGMRDKEYELAKSPGTYRIAMLGSSHVLGWGVNDGEMFEPRLEDRLNKDLAGKPWDKYEILNFSVNGYSPVCQVTTLDKNVAQFKPDAVWFVAHVNDPFWVMSRFAKAIRKKVPPPYPFLQKLQKEVELDENTPDLWAQRKLTPRWPEMMKFAYTEIVARAKAMGAQPVWIFMPGILARNESQEDGPILKKLAQEAGFVIIDLPYSMYKGESADQLEIAPWDQHPNAHGHQLIADAMWDAMMAEKSLTLFSRTGGTETSTRAP